MASQFEQIAIYGGLNGLHNLVTHITICSGEPTTYALATGSLQLGFNSFGAGNAFGAPSQINTSLCTVSSVAITAATGTITTTGTASWWAAVDEINAVLYAHGVLLSPQPVTAGMGFGLASFSIALPLY